MRVPGRAWIASLLVLLVATTTRAAHADASEIDKATAQVFFEEGRALMEKGDVATACERFEQSRRLEAASGTLLNLALCHERAGRVATAWVTFHDALGAAVRDGRPDREAFAREHIDALRARLPRIVVRGETCEGCQLHLDGRLLDRAAIAIPTPVDPGAHRLVVRSPRGAESPATMASVREGEVITLDLPPPPAEAAAPEPSRTRQHAGIVALGTSAVALGVGTYFGVRALSLGSDADARCPTTACNDANATELSRQADTSAWVANVAVGTAVLAAGVGAYLLLTSRAPSPSTQSAMLGRLTF